MRFTSKAPGSKIERRWIGEGRGYVNSSPVLYADAMASDRSLTRRSAFGFSFMIAVMGGAIFLAAGTFAFWQGWLFLATFSVATVMITLYLLRHDPALLSRRVQGGPGAETDSRQKIIQTMAGLCFLALIVAPSLEQRFHVRPVGWPWVLGANLTIAAAYWAIYRVFRENSYASATIELAADQRVIETGPYAVVRHPMYAAAIPLIVAMPIALGSLWSALFALPLMAVINWRLVEEERFLRDNLAGYTAYASKVRYRLIPGLY